MEIPSRDFFRYLTLCSLTPREIQDVYGQHLLSLPHQVDQYYTEQAQWARALVGEGEATVVSALRLAGMQDMWNAHKNRKPGQWCTNAFHLMTQEQFRKPIEALLIAGFQDWEIKSAVNHSITHTYEISTEDVAAYRRYFFNPSILAARDRKFVVLNSEWVRIGMMGLEPDLLEYALGLRYTDSRDLSERSYERSLQKFLLTLESIPLRTDREGIKALASFLPIVKSLIPADKKVPDKIPLFELVRGTHDKLEELN